MSTALRLTFEEHFHQIFEYAAFVTEPGWAISKDHFDFLPALLRPVLLPLIRRDIRRAAWTRGVGRHAPEDIAAMAAADLAAAAALLGDKPFFFGDAPTTVDCAVHGFVAMALWAPIPSFEGAVERHPELVAFCERMKARTGSETSARAVSAA